MQPIPPRASPSHKFQILNGWFHLGLSWHFCKNAEDLCRNGNRGQFLGFFCLDFNQHSRLGLSLSFFSGEVLGGRFSNVKDLSLPKSRSTSLSKDSLWGRELEAEVRFNVLSVFWPSLSSQFRNDVGFVQSCLSAVFPKCQPWCDPGIPDLKPVKGQAQSDRPHQTQHTMPSNYIKAESQSPITKCMTSKIVNYN